MARGGWCDRGGADDASGKPAAIAAKVGSFIGTSERTLVIGLDRLQVNADGDLVTALADAGATTSASKPTTW